MNVPLIKQHYKKGCGAAVLSMVFKYFRDNISEKEIVKELGGFKSYGLKTTDLARFAKQKGYKLECLTFNKERLDKLVTLKTPETSDIIKFLEKNIPVIINVNVSAFRKTEPNNRGHIIVITDYKNGKFFYNDSSINYGGKHVIEHDHLMFCWGANALTSSAYLLAVWR